VAIGALEGRAINQLAPYVTGETVALASLEELIGVLELAFGDPDKAGTAQRELEKLKMGAKDTFSSYFANF
jgi:hypothetical protein